MACATGDVIKLEQSFCCNDTVPQLAPCTLAQTLATGQKPVDIAQLETSPGDPTHTVHTTGTIVEHKGWSVGESGGATCERYKDWHKASS